MFDEPKNHKANLQGIVNKFNIHCIGWVDEYQQGIIDEEKFRYRMKRFIEQNVLDFLAQEDIEYIAKKRLEEVLMNYVNEKYGQRE